MSAKSVWRVLWSAADTIVTTAVISILLIGALAWMYANLSMNFLAFLWGVTVLYLLLGIGRNVAAIRERLTETPKERGIRMMVEEYKKKSAQE